MRRVLAQKVFEERVARLMTRFCGEQAAAAYARQISGAIGAMPTDAIRATVGDLGELVEAMRDLAKDLGPDAKH